MPYIWLLILLSFCGSDALAQAVRASGAVSVALPMLEAANILRAERKIDLTLRAGGGTEMGLDSLGDKTAEIALCSRELTPVDRSEFPAIQFTEIPIGVQLLAIAVSRDVWEGGVHSLNADQIRAIYERRLTNWRDLGGPDLPIKVFMSEPGRGLWEVFVQWLYKEIKKAPVWRGSKVKEIQEARNMLEFTPGCFALIPPGFVDHQNVFALAIQDDSGNPVAPTLANVLKEKYPLSRPLMLVINDKPTGAIKVVVDFMTGPRGQAIIRRCGYVTLQELQAAKEKQ